MLGFWQNGIFGQKFDLLNSVQNDPECNQVNKNSQTLPFIWKLGKNSSFGGGATFVINDKNRFKRQNN